MDPGVLDRTESNMEGIARRLKETGIPGYQIITISGLAGAGTTPDRQTFYCTGTKIIVPPGFSEAGQPSYNVGAVLGICINEEGTDDDQWFDFDLSVAYNLIQQKIKNILFNKITVRNYRASASPELRLWVFQDPMFIQQVNAMLKDITP